MTAPSKGENKTSPDNTKLSDDNTPNSPPARSKKSGDIIPIPLVIGIFAIVMGVTFFALADNWYTDMTRYRSLKAERTGHWQKAIDQLDKLVKLAKDNGDKATATNPTYLSELGLCYLNLKQYDKALSYYQQAQKYNSNIPPDDQGNARPSYDFHNKIGLTYFQMGQLDNAEKALQSALVYNKLDPASNFTLGQIAMDRGNYIQAADFFKVVAANPGYEAQVKKYYAQIETKLFAGIG